MSRLTAKVHFSSFPCCVLLIYSLPVFLAAVRSALAASGPLGEAQAPAERCDRSWRLHGCRPPPARRCPQEPRERQNHSYSATNLYSFVLVSRASITKAQGPTVLPSCCCPAGRHRLPGASRPGGTASSSCSLDTWLTSERCARHQRARAASAQLLLASDQREALWTVSVYYTPCPTVRALRTSENMQSLAGPRPPFPLHLEAPSPSHTCDPVISPLQAGQCWQQPRGVGRASAGSHGPGWPVSSLTS